ncbi:MAG: type II secretion system F family protein [Haloarculaceae archaeon]
MALNPLGLAPLGVVVVLLGVVLYGQVDEGWNRSLSRFARRLFGRYVTENEDRRRLIESAYVGTTYRAYAARTLLYTGLAAVCGAILGTYLFGGILLAIPGLVHLLMGLPETMVRAFGLRGFQLVLSETGTLIVVTAGGLIGGLVGAGLTYLLRWELLKSRAEVRRRAIDAGLARTVAFMYALSRGGIAFPQTLRTLANNDDIYGENAREAGVAVREMDLFGRDMITALRRMSRRTPSETFKTFSENLASVLQSGRSLSTFLSDQYERYQEEAQERQEDLLERLATIAEAYVTVFVAAVLFLVTILLVFGLTTTDTLWLLQLLGYVVVPLANVGFIVYLGQRLEELGIQQCGNDAPLADYRTATLGRPDLSSPRADGGAALDERRRQLQFYDRAQRVLRLLRQPGRTIMRQPTRIFYVTVPLAAVYLLWRAPAAFQTSAVNLRILDDVLVQTALFLLATYAVVRTYYTRRIDRIEAATPELFDRLASLNEAGMTLVESLERTRGSDLGVLTDEVDRIWADVQMGANADDAFVRFGRRVRTTAISRIVTLLVNAMRSSGQLGPVLRIASQQIRSDLRMRRQRRQQMLTYLVVIYISFLVFLVIIVAVESVLVPSLPSNVPTPSSTNRLGVDASQFARLGQVNKAAYTLIFFHIALIQSVLSGFVGGQLGEGSLRDGAKHAAIMLAVAYGVFLLVSAPVASLTVNDPATVGDSLTVQSADLSDGGYLVVHASDANGTVLGRSAYLVPGTHHDVRIDLSRSVGAGHDVTVVVHMDTDDDQAFEYDGGELDRPYPAAGQGRWVTVTVEAR